MPAHEPACSRLAAKARIEASPPQRSRPRRHEKAVHGALGRLVRGRGSLFTVKAQKNFSTCHSRWRRERAPAQMARGRYYNGNGAHLNMHPVGFKQRHGGDSGYRPEAVFELDDRRRAGRRWLLSSKIRP